MNNTEITKVIPYSTIINIIKNCENQTTKDLIAFQYTFGCRAGELAKEYTHKYYKTSKRFTQQNYISIGPTNKDFSSNIIGELTFRKPNFKQAKIKNRAKEISGISRFSTFVLQSAEPYLYYLIYKRVFSKSSDEPIFDLKESSIRKKIDKELKRYDVNYSSHWLRHSRARHIAELTSDPSAVQSLLGHADMNTTMRYINRLSVAFRKAVSNGQRVEDLLGKRIGED
jgi:hypothetical protein